MKESKNWDYPVSVDELLSNTNVVYLDLTTQTFAQIDYIKDICMYIPYENKREYVRVEVELDGVFYAGSHSLENNDPYSLGDHIIKTTPDEAIEIFDQYQVAMIESEKVTHLLANHWDNVIVTARVLVVDI